jgi:hypothetical protein
MMKIVAAISLTIPAIPVAAQAPPAQAAAVQKQQPKSDLDRIVCERQEEIGSRLAIRKVCMTVRQWQEQRFVQRQDFEKVQQVVNQNPTK